MAAFYRLSRILSEVNIIKKVILIHGYFRKSKDMKPLSKNLSALGYYPVCMDFPLTFKSFVDSFPILEDMISKDKHDEIYLVGHSTGGLLIRYFLKKSHYAKKIKRCVLIAAPNTGSELADTTSNISKTFLNIFRTLKSIQTKNINKLKLNDIKNIDIGVIAGSKKGILFGHLLDSENDGRVSIHSTKFDGIKDFIVLDYGHKKIHHKYKTARLVDRFLRDGNF